MSKLDSFREHINSFFSEYQGDFDCIDSLHNASHDDSGDKYLIENVSYNDMPSISMDYIVKNGYRKYKQATTGSWPSSADSFLIDKDNFWYFIEFKNAKISSSKKSIESKGLNNLLMLIDLMKHSEKPDEIEFDNNDPMKFIREKCVYIVVFSGDKDPYSQNRVREFDRISEKYTPECLEKFKQFYFKDSYAYTVEYFEKRFLSTFAYE